MCNPDNAIKTLPRDHSPPTQLVNTKSTNINSYEKKLKEDELKLDIHIFAINEKEEFKGSTSKILNNSKSNCSVEVQTKLFSCSSTTKMRNVSTQHRARVQKLPRSFGTLTVTPWSGTMSEAGDNKVDIDCCKESQKNLKGVYTVPFSSI